MKSVIIAVLAALLVPACALLDAGHDFGIYDGYVIDEVDGLGWEAEIDETPVTLAEARARCDKLETGGFTDWAVPDYYDAGKLIDVDETQSPYVDHRAFPDLACGPIWFADAAVTDCPAAATNCGGYDFCETTPVTAPVGSDQFMSLCVSYKAGASDD
jgi:hypothetical protein